MSAPKGSKNGNKYGVEDEDDDIQIISHRKKKNFADCASFDADCPICLKNFSDYDAFRLHHINDHAKGVNSFLCPECSKGCGSFHNYTAHYPQHYGKNKWEREMYFGWKCEIGACRKRCSSKYNLKSHLRTHGIDAFFVETRPNVKGLFFFDE